MVVFEVLAALVLFVCVHESGHVLVARFLGDRSARFSLVDFEEGRPILAVTRTAPYDRFSDVQNICIALGGVLTTRLVAELVVLSKTQPVVFDSLEAFWIAFFLLLRTDLWLYSVRSFAGYFLEPQNHGDKDIFQAAHFLAKFTPLSQGQWLGLFLATTTLELALDLPRILGFLL